MNINSEGGNNGVGHDAALAMKMERIVHTMEAVYTGTTTRLNQHSVVIHKIEGFDARLIVLESFNKKIDAKLEAIQSDLRRLTRGAAVAAAMLLAAVIFT